MKADNDKFHETLPSSRLDRRYKQIEVILKAPEFSENEQKADQAKYEHQFDIDDRYKDLSQVDLAKTVIDKYLEAGALITSKLKAEDQFDLETYNRTLLAIREKIDEGFLKETTDRLAAEVKKEAIDKAIALRKERQHSNKIKDKVIRDFRVYLRGVEQKRLYPYDYQYCEIFLNLLRKHNVKFPVYHHIYIGVAGSIDECLEHFKTYDHWQQYGLSVIDYSNYQSETEKGKEKIVFDVIVEGLRDLAAIDHLDKEAIEKVIDEIKIKGLDTELVLSIIESKTHKLTITYFSRDMEEKCPVYFNLLEKATGKLKRKEIGRVNNDQLYFWLQKVTLTKTHIKVKSGNSIAADVSLKDLPRNMEFDIKEFINE
ncbi:hypothetical protein GCM10028827_36310 [Mucilaginibacter myungsuensis]